MIHQYDVSDKIDATTNDVNVVDVVKSKSSPFDISFKLAKFLAIGRLTWGWYHHQKYWDGLQVHHANIVVKMHGNGKKFVKKGQNEDVQEHTNMEQFVESRILLIFMVLYLHSCTQ